MKTQPRFGVSRETNHEHTFATLIYLARFAIYTFEKRLPPSRGSIRSWRGRQGETAQ
jgi:hypothetical protein